MPNVGDLQGRLDRLAAEADFETSVAVLHVERGERAGVNGRQPWPACSVFKVPVLVETYRQATAGEFSMLNRWLLQDDDKATGSGVLQLLEAHLAPTVRDLVTLMITISDNTAADILVRRLEPKRITKTMGDLGLKDTRVSVTCREMLETIQGPTDVRELQFQRALRLKASGHVADERAFQAGNENNVTSTEDMTNLFGWLITGEPLGRIGLGRRQCDQMLDILYRQQINERLPRFLPATVPFAHKTGTLFGAYAIHNDAGVMTLENGEHVAVGAFTRAGVPEDAGPRELAALRRALDDFIAETARIAYDHYSE